MAERTPRILHGNLLALPGVRARSSSEDSAATIHSMLDPLPTAKWRSQGGTWTVTADFNDILDITVEETAYAVELTPGTYVSPDAVCQHVIARLEATIEPPDWSVTYDPATRKFMVSGGGAVFIGIHPLERSFWPDLGFLQERFSQEEEEADVASYHGREWIAFDLGTNVSVEAVVVYAHNLGAGNIRFVAGTAGSVWIPANRSIDVPILGDDPYQEAHLGKMRIAFLAAQAYRYVGFIIDDVSSVDGWAEIGHAQVSGYWQPGRSYRHGMTQRPQFLGNLIRTVEGGKFRGSRKMPLEFNITFPRLSRSDFDTYLALLKEIQDEHVYLALDPLNFPGSRTYYGMIDSVEAIPETVGDGTPPDRYTISFRFEEAPAS